jgi:hypothetical protein
MAAQSYPKRKLPAIPYDVNTIANQSVHVKATRGFSQAVGMGQGCGQAIDLWTGRTAPAEVEDVEIRRRTPSTDALSLRSVHTRSGRDLGALKQDAYKLSDTFGEEVRDQDEESVHSGGGLRALKQDAYKLSETVGRTSLAYAHCETLEQSSVGPRGGGQKTMASVLAG